MTTVRSREVQLAARPIGEPKLSDFKLIERELPPLSDGDVLVRNILMSVDPYMRGRMNDVKSYVPPFALNETLEGGAIGSVEESRNRSSSRAISSKTALAGARIRLERCWRWA